MAKPTPKGGAGTNQHAVKGVSVQAQRDAERAAAHAARAAQGAAGGVASLGEQMEFDFPPRAALKVEDLLRGSSLIRSEKSFDGRLDTLNKISVALESEPTEENWRGAFSAVAEFSDSVMEDSRSSTNPNEFLRERFKEAQRPMRDIITLQSAKGARDWTFPSKELRKVADFMCAAGVLKLAETDKEVVDIRKRMNEFGFMSRGAARGARRMTETSFQ